MQIGSDGGRLERPVDRRSIPLEPAERVDVIVDFRQLGVGSKIILHNVPGEATTSAVMRFDVIKSGTEQARIPRVLAGEEGIPQSNAERFVDARLPGPGQRRLNVAGRRWRDFGDASRLPPAPRSTDLWTWQNLSPRTHPMHLHGYHFKAFSVDGKPPHPGDAEWKDAVAVYANQTVVVQPYFDFF